MVPTLFGLASIIHADIRISRIAASSYAVACVVCGAKQTYLRLTSVPTGDLKQSLRPIELWRVFMSAG